MDLREYQERVGVWLDASLPNTSIPIEALALCEEAGEAARAVVKMELGIRGTREQWMKELEDEVGGVFAALLCLCHKAGIDLQAAVEVQWAKTLATDLSVTRMPDRDPGLYDLTTEHLNLATKACVPPPCPSFQDAHLDVIRSQRPGETEAEFWARDREEGQEEGQRP
jgi:NTP pyrophosphatase (non-canonical NTP hydrolase)